MTREQGRRDDQATSELAGQRGGDPTMLPAFALEVVRSADPKRIATLIHELPELSSAVMASLHQTFGAAFVQAVLSAQPPAPQARAAQPVQASGPTLGPDPKGPEHEFAGTGDQELLWQRVSPMLSGASPATGLGAEVANMDRIHRDRVLERLSDVAKHAGGAAVLQIADLVGAAPGVKIRTAIAGHPPATAAQLRAHLLHLDPADVVAALDADTMSALSAAHPDPGLVVPQLGELGRTVAGNVPLIRWLIKSSTPERLAVTMMRIDESSINTLAKSLTAIGVDGWKWAMHIDAGTAAIGEARASKFAAVAPADVSAALLAVAPQHDRNSQAGDAPGGSAALTKLVSGGAIDMAALTAALATAGTFETNEIYRLTKSPYKERLIASASFEQLYVLTEALFLLPVDQLAWWLESPHASVEGIRAVAANWSPAAVDYAMGPANVRKVQAMFPAAGPDDLFGTQTADLYARALTNAPLRRWCAKGADPRQLLHLVTQRPDSVALMWRALVKDGVSSSWVYELGTGIDDAALRMLALNCPDGAIGTWIREHLLGDRIVAESASNAVAPIPAIATETSTQRRVEAGLEDDVTPRELGRRTSELTEADAQRIRSNPDELQQILGKIEEPWVSRALFKLQPTTKDVLRYANVDGAGVTAYLRGRSHEETIEALADPTVANGVFWRIQSPFTKVPALATPVTLAAVVRKNPDVIGWILRTTDARYAILQLGHPAVAAATGKGFDRSHLELLPSIIELSNDEGAALERIASHVHKSGLAELLRDRGISEGDETDESDTSEEPTPAPRTSADTKVEPTATEIIDERQHRIDLVLQHPDLDGALQSALMGDPDRFVVLAVCRAHPEGAMAFVTDPKNARYINQLRKVLADSPISVFPQVPYYAFLHTAAARRWLFETESAPVLLRELTSPDAPISLLTKPLDAQDFGTHQWLRALPQGTQLTGFEQRAVRTVFDAVETNQAARELFGVRFGAMAAESYSKRELIRLWGVLERLPPSHAAQSAVNSFHEFADEGGTAGLYSGHAISLREGLLRNDEKTDGYDQEMLLTREQVMAAYQIDDKQLEARVAQGQFELKDTPEGPRYEVKPQNQKMLDNVVLHEVGHGVDDILGSHNELVYGLAGWKEFGESDIPAFAEEFGGWDRVKAADRPRIVEAWQIWFNSTRGDNTKGLDAFVGDDHPARSKDYAGVGIVDIARRNQPIDAYNMAPIAGKVPVAHHGYSKLYRVPETTMHAAPSLYAMTAPAEFFAECYAEYYRAYDGTPNTNDKKGGRLPGWIKSWFDANIDKLAFNPARR